MRSKGKTTAFSAAITAAGSTAKANAKMTIRLAIKTFPLDARTAFSAA